MYHPLENGYIIDNNTPRNPGDRKADANFFYYQEKNKVAFGKTMDTLETPFMSKTEAIDYVKQNYIPKIANDLIKFLDYYMD